jgi:hypothetical protein
MAKAFQKVTPPAQSSPLIVLGLNIPAAWVSQPLSLPTPVEKITAAGISLHIPDAKFV